ncbi:MAG: segregation and condensation protein A [Limisphaerales bacterium]
MSDYQVKFDVFEGPLDLLLHLIRKEEVDIYEVNLTKIATEFVACLDLMRELDLDIAGEFLVMAATLMLIKSRELLPVDQRPEAGPDDEALEDPRWELIRQLVEYKKFKDAAARLQQLENDTGNTYPRVPGRLEMPDEPVSRRGEAGLFDLLGAVNAVLRRFQSRQGDTRDVFEDRWTVSEKIQSVLAQVIARGPLRFAELFHEATSRAEVVVTFLALLELVRMRQLTAGQDEAFGEIVIAPAPPPETPERVNESAAEAAAAEPPADAPRWN